MVKQKESLDCNDKPLDTVIKESMSEINGDLDPNDDREALDLVSNSINTHGLRENKRKLVLHFDIRNTVLVADSYSNVHVEQALNSFLTGVTWGRKGPRWVG